MAATPRLAVALCFGAFGATIGTHLGAMPFIIKAASASPSAFGMIGTLGMLCNILAMSAGGWINRNLDHRSVLLIIIPACHVALWYALLVNSVASLAISFVVISFGLGTFDLFMNAEGAAVEQDKPKPFFSGFHGIATLSIAVSALAGSLLSGLLAPWWGGIYALVPAAVAWAAVYRAIPHRRVEIAALAGKPVAMPRAILTLAGLAGGLNVACELAALQWAGQLLAAKAPELAAISGLGIAFYGLCGGLVRLVGDRLRAAFGDFTVLAASISLAIAGFVTLGASPGFAVSVVAFAAVGFGLALVFPSLFALAASLVPQARAAALSYVAAVGGLPRVVLPWVLGVLAGMFSLDAVFLAAGVVAAMALLLIYLTYRATWRAPQAAA